MSGWPSEWCSSNDRMRPQRCCPEGAGSLRRTRRAQHSCRRQALSLAAHSTHKVLVQRHLALMSR
jgi:hypothetical protein